jgi:hypothetical protein
MKVFFDCEFTGLHQYTTLISIGLVTENGYEFYAEATDYDRSQIDDWLKTNVIDHLSLGEMEQGRIDFDQDTPPEETPTLLKLRGTCGFIATTLSDWLSQFGNVEMWSDCLSYDWILFCQLWGGGVECLPRNVYYIPFDIATVFKIQGIDPDINRETFAFGQYLEEMRNQKHNALWDAKVIKACCERLMRDGGNDNS